jgi:two-component system, OmpR family, sensor histidine kinase BaeS
MPDPRHHRHRPPPWWPEGEPWAGRYAHAPWGGVRHRLFRALITVVVLLVVIGVGTGLLVAASISGRGWRPVLLGMVVLGALFLFMAANGFRRIWSPVRNLTVGAARLAEGDYTTRVKAAGPPPVQSAISSFNRMAERLEAAEERRRALLADISHELRTPLTVIQGGLEAMLDGVHPLDQDHLIHILEETRVVERLLEDLRTISLVEAGRLRLEVEPCDPVSLIGDAVAPFQLQAKESGVEVDLILPQELPPIEADPVRLRQVIANLVTNALRYMPDGGRLTIGAATNDDSLQVRVTDTGPGIPPEHLSHIFERYQKSSDSSGVGLGLAIVRGLIEAHGGQVTASSTEGNGTTIEFSVPITFRTREEAAAHG